MTTKLEDLTPKPVDFSVSDVQLTFRPFTIADDLRTHKLCGSQQAVSDAFQNFDFQKISLLAWYQLELSSQRRVVECVESVYIDPESGEEEKANLTPIEKFRNLFLGFGDQILLLTKFIECKGLNIPDLDDEEALKKWMDQFDLKTP